MTTVVSKNRMKNKTVLIFEVDDSISDKDVFILGCNFFNEDVYLGNLFGVSKSVNRVLRKVNSE